MIAQNNISFWNTFFHQNIGNLYFCSIILNPNFIINDINVNQYSKNAFILIPSCMKNLIMILIGIKASQDLDFPISRLYIAIVFENFLNP